MAMLNVDSLTRWVFQAAVPAVGMILLAALPGMAATCATSAEMDDAARSALQQASLNFHKQAVAGDVAGLRAGAIPSLAGDFAGIESAIIQNQNNLKAGEATILGTYLLQAEGTAPLPRAEFYCGIYNSPDRVTFVIPNLPPGRYGIVTQTTAGENPMFFTTVLNEQAGAWKLAGLTIKRKAISGHDSAYFATQAREYAGKGQNLVAWLHYLQAWELMAPVNFMYTADRDKLVDEMQKAKPAELPTAETPLQVSGGGKTFAVIEVFSEPVEIESKTQMYLILKYRATTDVSNTADTFQVNREAIQAFLQRYPTMRTVFGGVVARAVDTSGRDYGTMFAMKDVK
ncbi:MAG: hypothetical protein AB7O65_00325 [Candidatus Korobacteraceae bacterium]